MDFGSIPYLGYESDNVEVMSQFIIKHPFSFAIGISLFELVSGRGL